MIFPSEKEFLTLTKKGNLIPVAREILGDLDTPVSAYYKIAEKSRYSFLLESVEGEEKVARFSFLASDPELIIQSKDHALEITRCHDGRSRKETQTIHDTPLHPIRQLMAGYRFVPVKGLPRFCGGLVGYMGYDLVRFFERLPDRPKDDLKLPDMILALAKSLIIFDHLNHKIQVVQCVHVDARASLKAKRTAYRKAVRQIEATVELIQCPLDERLINKKRRSSGPRAAGRVRSNFSCAQFERIVREAKKKIRAGDIIQTVLSQRFEVPLKTDGFHVYRMLRSLNPSPYMYFLNFNDIQIIGSSPEMLVRCEDGLVETRPIAGTRPRGKNEQEDQRLETELLRDPKERAEHLMLVDLGRNDLGRVARQGTVHVPQFMTIERYSHVMHIVSSVTGRLKKGKDAFDVLAAAFPAGTLSGAPKIRAMEIIDELENVSRGPYAGCICYFSFSGNFDSCITIRTIVAHRGKAYIQAGAGIVADSRPKKEYIETVNKAKAQIQALNLAVQQFGPSAKNH